jgi:ATP-binding cassette subfamily B protein
MKPASRASFYRRLLPYLWPHRRQIGLYLCLTLAIAAVELLSPWPMKLLVDSVVGSQPLPGPLRRLWAGDKIALLVAVVVGGLALKLLVSIIRIVTSFISVRMRQRIVLDLKCSLFDHLQKQSLSFYDTRRLGDIVTRVNSDVWGIDEWLLTVMPLLVASTTLVGMFWVMLSLNWRLALVALFVVPLFYVPYGWYSNRLDRQVEAVQKLEGESMSIVQEVLSALRVVKSFTREDHERARFLQQGESAAAARIRLTHHQVSYSMAAGFITAAGTALVLGAGAFQILQGRLTLGELLVVLAYLGSVYGPLESISSAATYMHAYLAKMRRIFEVLDVPPEAHDVPGAVVIGRARGRVVCENVSFAYPGRPPVLRDINLEAKPGEVIGIVGPNGAGKSTLVSLIPRFYDPREGRVLIDGRDVREVQLKSLRQQVSLVPQDPILFWGTVRENISYGWPQAGFEAIVEAARLANADDFIARLPGGYDCHVSERGLTLSGGEKQRLSIARAFLKDAPIVILDEPSSALDARSEVLLLQAIDRLMENRTTFIIAHRLSTLRGVDRILVLDRGQIIEQGTHAVLMGLGGLYSGLYRQQVDYART